MINRLNIDRSAIPPRVGIHQFVKGSAKAKNKSSVRCILCEYYTKALKSKRCSECINTDNLDNFKVDHLIKDEPWYRWTVEHDKE